MAKAKVKRKAKRAKRAKKKTTTYPSTYRGY